MKPLLFGTKVLSFLLLRFCHVVVIDWCFWPLESSLQAALHQSVFLSAMSAQPSRDLSLCWEQHRKLLPGVAGVHAETVQHWSVQQVREQRDAAAM